MRIDTRHYVRSWGKEPRGRGSWAYTLDDSQDILWAPSSTYGDAVKYIKKNYKTSEVAFILS